MVTPGLISRQFAEELAKSLSKAKKAITLYRPVNTGHCSCEEQWPVFTFRCTVYRKLIALLGSLGSFAAAARVLCV